MGLRVNELLMAAIIISQYHQRKVFDGRNDVSDSDR